MERKPLNGLDVQMLNEQLHSRDAQEADLAKQILFESAPHAECFVDSTAQEWARRIVNRVNRVNRINCADRIASCSVSGY